MTDANVSHVLINCDMGESFGLWQMGHDEAIMPYIDIANIACGFHAGDHQVMARTVELALKHNTKIGAHPGYMDRQGFGRRSMKLSPEEVRNLIWYQTGALNGIAGALGASLFHVKPHGALYNDMMRDEELLCAVMQSIALYDGDLKLIIQATPDWQKHARIAQGMGVELLFEAFSDRGYQSHGLLLPRGEVGALLDVDAAIAQSTSVLNHGEVTTPEGLPISLHVDTLCIHGDGENAVQIARAIRPESSLSR